MKIPTCLLLGSLLVATGASALAQAANPATTPVIRDEWRTRHEGYNATARKGGVDLLFLGDSITQGWNGNGKNVWTERYRPLKAANFGISGDRTEHVLWRVQNGNLEGINPKVVVLMIGTNNLPRNSGPETAEGIEAIVREIRGRLPESKVLLLGVFPRGGRPEGDWAARATMADINKTISGLADGQRVFFLDIGESFLEPDKTISKEVMYDALHLTAKGYQIWADAMQPTLDSLLK